MTGYGRADFTLGDEEFTLELKCLNHRYLDCKLRSPERFFWAEEKIREALKKRFSRGSFSILLRGGKGARQSVELDTDMVRSYMEAAGKLGELGLKGELDINSLLSHKEIFGSGAVAEDMDGDWKALSEGLAAAFTMVGEWRAKEGLSLKADLTARLDALSTMAAGIEERAPGINEAYREKLTERICTLVGDNVDESRLLAEAAIVAEKTAFDEEITRLSSHIDGFREYLDSSEPVGRKLDFLCQEILREVNTIGSKVSDIEVTRVVVELKAELEKIREQVQNIE